MTQSTRNPRSRNARISHPITGMIPRTMWMATKAMPKKIDCQEWNRTNEFLLYGSTIRKMIAGMIVT